MPASRFKTCRQISENVWQTKKLTQKQKAIILKLQKKTNKKQSDFSKELQTIQKLSLFYGKLPIEKMQRSKTQTYLDKKNSLLFDIERRFVSIIKWSIFLVFNYLTVILYLFKIILYISLDPK